jgi:DNA-binding FadR family transcriptional regulator
LFKPAKQNRIYEDVVEQIQEAILEGILKVGEQLPAERKLIEMFGVSRGTLREALRVLQQKGMIEIKTGVAGGSIVRGVNSEQLSENIGLLIRNRDVSLRDLAEFREGVEGGVAALAAQRRSEQDIATLNELLEEARQHFLTGQKGWDEFIRTDEKLHMALATISGNQLYINLLESVYCNIHTYYENYLPYEQLHYEENFKDLCNIVAAVTAGDPLQARELAQGHVSRFNAHMQKKTNRNHLSPARRPA